MDNEEINVITKDEIITISKNEYEDIIQLNKEAHQIVLNYLFLFDDIVKSLDRNIPICTIGGVSFPAFKEVILKIYSCSKYIYETNLKLIAEAVAGGSEEVIHIKSISYNLASDPAYLQWQVLKRYSSKLRNEFSKIPIYAIGGSKNKTLSVKATKLFLNESAKVRSRLKQMRGKGKDEIL